ncbi:MAG TPA: GNAT family N-acetyltransferase [Parvibaculum sp.]
MGSFAQPSKSIFVRPAWMDEGPALSALAMEAKAHWGYDDAFMELCRPELTVTRNKIGRERVRVAEAAGELVGFSSLRVGERKAWVENLFIRPGFIGKGVGHLLIRELIEYTRRHGILLVHVEADPNATDFYEREGFSLCGEVPSGSIPGRMLPLMELRF